jgi:hypothetical protein
MPSKKPAKAKPKASDKPKTQSVTIRDGTSVLNVKLPSGKIKTVKV